MGKKKEHKSSPISEIDYLFSGGGDMGTRIKNFNWEETSIGPIESWPQNLKTIVRIMLTSRQPIWIGWGPELIKLYNDPYKSILGGKHPDALGKPASVVWSEIWGDIEPMLNQVMQKNEGTYVEAQLLVMDRYGYPEETYYTFSYNPVPDENGQVGGMFCTNTDDTQRVLSERQLALLRTLAAETIKSTSIEEACALTIHSLQHNTADIPFAIIYLLDLDSQEYNLSGSFGLKTSIRAAPGTIKPGEDVLWPFDQLSDNAEIVIDDLSTRYSSLTGESWEPAASQAVIAPIGELSDSNAAVIVLD